MALPGRTLTKPRFSMERREQELKERKKNRTAFSQEERTVKDLLAFRLHLLSNTWSAISSVHYKQVFGLKNLEWRVLSAIGAHGGISLKGIIRFSGIEKAYASRTVAALVSAGFVVKDADAGDRRTLRLALTKKGMKMYRMVLQDSIRRNDEWMSVLNPNEQRNLDRYLIALTGYANQLAQIARRGDKGNDALPTRGSARL